MSGTAEIAISLATFKAIEAARLSMTESHDEIIRRIFARTQSRQGQIRREAVRLAPVARRRRGHVNLTIFGRDVPATNLKYAYLTALQSLVKHKPSLFEHLAGEGATRRRWAAPTAGELFAGSPHLVRDHAHEIMPGWFVDTNLSRAQIEQRLARACVIAGYRYGDDVQLAC
jgi:hypothetical protein